MNESVHELVSCTLPLSYLGNWLFWTEWLLLSTCPVVFDSFQLHGLAASQASLSFTISWNLLKLMSIEAVIPSNHLILCHSLLLLPSIFPSIRDFSKESTFRIRWLKYWSFSFSISPSNEYSGLSSFRPYSKYIIYLYFHFPMRLVLFRSHFTDKKIKTRED